VRLRGSAPDQAWEAVRAQGPFAVWLAAAVAIHFHWSWGLHRPSACGLWESVIR